MLMLKERLNLIFSRHRLCQKKTYFWNPERSDKSNLLLLSHYRKRKRVVLVHNIFGKRKERNLFLRICFKKVVWMHITCYRKIFILVMKRSSKSFLKATISYSHEYFWCRKNTKSNRISNCSYRFLSKI